MSLWPRRGLLNRWQGSSRWTCQSGEYRAAQPDIIIGPDNPHVTNFSRLRLSKEKQEGKRKYESDGGVRVGEFVCVYVCVCVCVCMCMYRWVGDVRGSESESESESERESESESERERARE